MTPSITASTGLDALTQLGRVRLLQGDIAAAEETLRAALDLDPRARDAASSAASMRLRVRSRSSSRSSALASKATGYPIAKIAALLAAVCPMPSYKSEPDKPAALKRIDIYGLAQQIDLSRVQAELTGNHLARWLSAMPANELTPAVYREIVTELAGKEGWPGRSPTLTSEIAHERNYELATIASRNRLQIVSSAKVISKVIVQAIRNPGLSNVYNELFSYAGNSIYVQQVPECTDLAIEEIAYRITDAVPVGITWKKRQDGNVKHAVALNPEPDYEIAEDEKLVFIARSLPVHYLESETGYQSSLAQEGGGRTRVPRRVLLIGWTDMIYDILLELDAHSLQGSEITILCGRPPEDALKRIEEHQQEPFKNVALAFIQGDAADAEVYADIDLNSYQSLVVLADDWGDDKGDVDTRTLRILLRLSDLRKYDEARAHTVVELVDEANSDLIAGMHVDDVIISPIVVSAQLAQIARQDVLGPIYRELLSAGGVEISLRPVADYVALNTDCRYNDLVYAAQQKLEIALGLRLSRNNGDVLLNPPRDKTWRLSENDQVIVLAQQLY